MKFNNLNVFDNIVNQQNITAQKYGNFSLNSSSVTDGEEGANAPWQLQCRPLF